MQYRKYSAFCNAHYVLGRLKLAWPQAETADGWLPHALLDIKINLLMHTVASCARSIAIQPAQLTQFRLERSG